MKPAPFDYHAPRTVESALELLSGHGDDARILAGGQSLIPLLNFRLARPAVLIDINGIGGLDYISEENGSISIGALTRQRRVEKWAARGAPLLAEALDHVGHVAIRTRGTVAGSLAHADPAAELPALFLCLDGSVLVRSAAGTREVPARALFASHLTTTLRADELITEVRVPLPAARHGWGFLEVSPRHGDFALVGVVAVVALARRRIAHARIALFGCGPTPLRAAAAERLLAGQAPTPAAIEAAAREAADALRPESDLHASAAYRTRVACTLVARALSAAVERATDEEP